MCFCESVSLISVFGQQLPVGKVESEKNMEIDLLQENQNCDKKNLVRNMGPNKTDKAIRRASRASGGIRKIVDNFDTISNVKPISGKHTYASSLKDEKVILNYLTAICPFTTIPGRAHRSFEAITNQDPIKEIDEKGFKEWCNHTSRKS